MRILGVLLILSGLVLCLTIVGLPFGLFLIFVGVVCAALGGRRRVVVNNVVQVAATPGSNLQANVTDDARQPFRTFEPDHRRVEPLVDVTPRRVEPPTTGGNGAKFDRIKWDALVQYDSDIARIVDILRPYGQKYVDELATAYLAINDKEYLPMIVKKIVATARKDAGSGPAAEAAT